MGDIIPFPKKADGPPKRERRRGIHSGFPRTRQEVGVVTPQRIAPLINHMMLKLRESGPVPSAYKMDCYDMDRAMRFRDGHAYSSFVIDFNEDKRWETDGPHALYITHEGLGDFEWVRFQSGPHGVANEQRKFLKYLRNYMKDNQELLYGVVILPIVLTDMIYNRGEIDIVEMFGLTEGITGTATDLLCVTDINGKRVATIVSFAFLFGTEIVRFEYMLERCAKSFLERKTGQTLDDDLFWDGE